MERGKRFNKGKLPLQYLPTNSLEQVAKVFQKGAEKYGYNNWQKGLPWKEVIGSIHRHVYDFEKGCDRDEETGLHQLAHVIANCMFLIEFEKIAPHYDDRISWPKLKIGFDIDGVVYTDPKIINSQNQKFSFKPEFDYQNGKVDKEICLFQPTAYITHRSKELQYITEYCIEANELPCAPIYHVEYGKPKSNICKELGIQVFVEDNIEHFIELNQNNICCFLITREYNKRFNAYGKRINSLKELYDRLY